MVTIPEADKDRFWRTVERLKTTKAPVKADRRITEGSWVSPGLKVRAKYLRGGETLRHATVAGVIYEEEAKAPVQHARPRQPADFKEPSYHDPQLDHVPIGSAACGMYRL